MSPVSFKETLNNQNLKDMLSQSLRDEGERGLRCPACGCGEVIMIHDNHFKCLVCEEEFKND